MIAIAALYRCLVRAAVLRPDALPAAGAVERAVAAENVWQAQRAGVNATFVDAPTGTARPVAAVLDAVLALIAEDAEALGCAAAVADARRIVADGTSADLQRAAFAAARQGGADATAALRAVVARLAAVSGA